MPALVPTVATAADPLQVLSAFVGWSYFVAWTISFYPQVILNYRRQFVGGLSIDFAILNVLGHTSYMVYNLSYYLNKDVQEEYRRRHDGSNNTIQLNDVAFSVHASILAGITAFQTFYYPRAQGQRLSTFNRVVVSLFAIVVLANLNGVYIIRHEHLLDFIQVLATFKLYVSIAKYVPQAWENYSRKSTQGWSIENVLLDFSGGALSFLQLFIDAARGKDWTSIIGNPAKFGLSVLSIIFTLLFIVQHYVLYTNHSDEHLEPYVHETRESRGRSVSLERSVASLKGKPAKSVGDIERGSTATSESSPLLG